MIKSLRLRLQLFHAIILTLAIVLFGGAFYRQLHRSTMGEIDAGLLSGARVLEGRLRNLPPSVSDDLMQRFPLELPHMLDRRRPPPPPPNLDRDEMFSNDSQRRGDLNNQPRDTRRRPDSGPGRRTGNSFESQLELRPEESQGQPDFRGDETQRLGPPLSPPYFVLFAEDGTLLRSDTNSAFQVSWTPTRRPVEYRHVEERREVLLRGPRRMLIIVGREIGPELQRLTSALVQLVLIGTAVLGLGLVGGWWLAGNAIQPIHQISRTVESIHERNLAERIHTASMDRELQSLGLNLNSMLTRIENAFDKQRQFTADASHDLRTPLAVIQSHCELSLSRPRSAEEHQLSLRTCLASAGHMKSIVEGLLVLARTDAGELDLQPTPIDLRDLAMEAVELFTPYAAEHHVELKLIGNDAPCSADRAAMSKVIANLLDNAILYNREGGSVTLGTSCNTGKAAIQIQDTGHGIPADALPRIFDRFYRVDEVRFRRSVNPGQSGSGLGLSICKEIVEAHGGKLSVTSELTKGSLFRVELPTNRS